jgi:hypothetical protein
VRELPSMGFPDFRKDEVRPAMRVRSEPLRTIHRRVRWIPGPFPAPAPAAIPMFMPTGCRTTINRGRVLVRENQRPSWVGCHGQCVDVTDHRGVLRDNRRAGGNRGPGSTAFRRKNWRPTATPFPGRILTGISRRVPRSTAGSGDGLN